MTTRKAVDYEGLGIPPESIALGHKGIAGSRVLEPSPEYNKADNETIIKGKSDAKIIFGRDRPGSKISGLGHEHKASRIDIVVGYSSAKNVGSVDESGEPIIVDPSFKDDAARIYLSQKANIDDYNGLASGKVGMSRAKSAIGMKADAVRIIAREGIKLVTKTEATNSHGGTIEKVGGIDLIAGNDDSDLQPLVKGDNMVRVVEDLYAKIGKLNGIVDGILLEQMQMNTAITAHVHNVIPIPFKGLVAIPDFEILLPVAVKSAIMNVKQTIDMKLHRTDVEFSKMNSTKPFGRDYILSRYNNTN